MDKDILEKALIKSEKIFIFPKPLYDYREIIFGITVNGRAVPIITENNFLAFGYHDLNSRDAMDIYTDYFMSYRYEILDRLKNIFSLEDIDIFEKELYTDIYGRLRDYNVKKIDSYNRIRKTINLYIEYIVSLSDEIEAQDRIHIVPFLFMPLDRYTFECKYIFTKPELARWNIKRTSTLGEINSESKFSEMQGCLYDKAINLSKQLGKDFYRIYFDIFKKSRINSEYNNLFLVDMTKTQALNFK